MSLYLININRMLHLIDATLLSLHGVLDYFVINERMNITVCDNSTAQFTFFLISLVWTLSLSQVDLGLLLYLPLVSHHLNLKIIIIQEWQNMAKISLKKKIKKICQNSCDFCYFLLSFWFQKNIAGTRFT